MEAPPGLSRVAPILRRAEDLDRMASKDATCSRMAWYCRHAAMKIGLDMVKANPVPAHQDFLLTLMDRIEADRATLGLTPEDEVSDLEAVKVYGLNIFKRADDMDREGRSDQNTARAFSSAANYLDVVRTLQGGDTQLDSITKYAKGRAAEIVQAVKSGAPVPPPADDLGLGFDLPAVPDDSLEAPPPAPATATFTLPAAAPAAAAPSNASYGTGHGTGAGMGRGGSMDAHPGSAGSTAASAPAAFPAYASPPTSNASGVPGAPTVPPAYPVTTSAAMTAPASPYSMQSAPAPAPTPSPATAPPAPTSTAAPAPSTGSSLMSSITSTLASLAPSSPALQHALSSASGRPAGQRGRMLPQPIMNDAMEYTRFALQALKEGDPDLAAERLRGALQTLGR